MEQRLIEKFATQFKPVDKKVKDEDILLFLDKRSHERFDRDTFHELKGRLEDRGLELTPVNFARVYNQAYDLLELKHKRTSEELNNIDKMGRLIKSARGQVVRIDISSIVLENYTDSSNFLQFEVSKDFVVNVYNFTSENYACLYVPEDKLGVASVTLFASSGKLLDRKTLDLSRNTDKPQRVQFNDNSVLTFYAFNEPVGPSEFGPALTSKKAELQNFQIFVRAKRATLIETFKDVYQNSSKTVSKSGACSKLLITCVILTSLMFGISLYLNFTRCMFIDIFVATSFFGNMYIWRNFNIFLGIKLILVLAASIFMDIGWEVTKLVHYTHKYEDTLKWVRIQGLVLNAVNVVIKLALIYLYYQLSNENQKGGFLAINEEVSINEVNEDEYLMRLPNYEENKFLSN